ncbi:MULTISPECIES: helix-turn-helix domain-containing protein [Lactiplantibacillus]|uniref:helix-turn-helix domain-containing protein n=1 Tax=Lactiplantibacillus TaxID=2767842 RepID=UPI0006EE6E92|nr:MULTISPECIES: helix-turn-helix transcriptional regulator [Lactiplantibacillus]KRL90035.1 hypothetical protein FD10_GL001682 [Lactiplantibacillus argentoratensis DSM 16365]
MIVLIKIDLKKLAKSKGFTLTDISKATGISMNTLSVLGRNVSTGIQFDTLDKICRFLTCTPNDIIKVLPDDYIVQVPAQKSEDDAIYAIGVKETVIHKSIVENSMYDADAEENIFYVKLISYTDNEAIFFVGLPVGSGFFNTPTESEEKTTKWLVSLNERNRASISKQATGIYLENYWNKKIALPQKVSIVFNVPNQGSVYSFTLHEKDNHVLLEDH